MVTNELKAKTLSGLTWQFAQRILGQFLSFVVTVILARMLMPNDYGVVALASMFCFLLGTFTDMGLNAALVQKKDVDELDYNTVFYTCLALSFLIYAILFFLAPYIAYIFKNSQICPIIRVISLTIPIGAFSSVQNAKVSRNLQFKKFFYATLSGQIIAAGVGIGMAYTGYGPWALVGQSMTSNIANTFVMFLIVRWHPRWMYSFVRFKSLFQFAGSKFAAGFIGTLCSQLKGYLIGYKYSAADLAFYNRGEGLPNIIENNISGTINGVLFPALSKLQDDKGKVKTGIRRSMMTSSYILSPIFLGLAAVSYQLVPLLYSPKWNQSIPFMIFACLTGIVSVLSSTNLQAILAVGRADTLLKLEFIKKPVFFAILAITVSISPIAISAGMFVYSSFTVVVNAFPNKKYIDYSLSEQLRDVMTSILLSFLMALLVYIIGILIPNLYLSLIIQILFGTVFYVGLSYILKLEAFLYAKKTILDMLGNKLRIK